MKNKNIIFFLLIIPILLCITGCSKNDCSNGKITGKYYRKPYTTYVKSGKVFVPIHHSEKWQIELNESCTFEVRKEEFKKYEIGQKIEKNYKIEKGN